MADDQADSFHFLDFPAEIRNNIYREILCCFDPPEPPSSDLDFDKRNSIVPATHSVDTAILRTCRQVHREAYDVMVKTNQFIKISSVDITLSQLLLSARLPIITMDRAIADQFQGCLMKVDLSVVPGQWVDWPLDEGVDWEGDFDSDIHLPPAGTGPRFNFLVLGRDWNVFCEMIGTADIKGFGKNVKIELTMNAYPEQIPDYKAPITHYFTTERQKNLLGNFDSALRGFSHVSLQGTIDAQLAQTIVQAVSARRWTSFDGVLRDLRARKEACEKLWETSQHDSFQMYIKTMVLMRRIHGSSDFSELVDEGDGQFLEAFEELHFTILLDMCHRILERIRGLQNTDHILSLTDMLFYCFRQAEDSTEDFEEEEDSTFTPSPAQIGSLYYTLAAGSRLRGQALGDARRAEVRAEVVRYMMQATDAIEAAIGLAPGDAEIQAEKTRISEWVPARLWR